MMNTEPLPTPKQDVAAASEMSRRGFLGLVAGGVAAWALAGCESGESPDTAPPAEPATHESEPTKPGGEFMTEPSWSQNFNHMPDGSIDPKAWSFDLDPAIPTWNNELQGYTGRTQNVRVEKGHLVIEAHREPYQYPGDTARYDFTSARITTHDKFSAEYGKWEATMRLPTAPGTWPAFWLLSENEPFSKKLMPTATDAELADNFYTHDGEIDIMEAYGTMPGRVEGTVHTYNTRHDSPYLQTKVAKPDTEFHTYGVEVRPDRIVWLLDNKPYFTYEKPSNNPDDWPIGRGNKFYMLLNLAMGGAEPAGTPDPKQDAWRMEVKNVNFYEYTGAH